MFNRTQRDGIREPRRGKPIQMQYIIITFCKLLIKFTFSINTKMYDILSHIYIRT